MKKNWLTIILAVLIGSLSLSGCGPGGTTEQSTQPPVLTQAPVTGLPAEVDRTIRLDPATVDDEDSLIISSLVYDGLTRFDENWNPQPALAIDWTISDD